MDFAKLVDFVNLVGLIDFDFFLQFSSILFSLITFKEFFESSLFSDSEIFVLFLSFLILSTGFRNYASALTFVFPALYKG